MELNIFFIIYLLSTVFQVCLKQEKEITYFGSRPNFPEVCPSGMNPCGCHLLAAL